MGDIVRSAGLGAILGGLGAALIPGGLGLLAGLALGGALGAAGSIIQRKQADIQDLRKASFERRFTVRGSAEPHRLIYGEVEVAGYLAYIGTTGDRGEYLHMMLVLAGHNCDSIVTTKVEDELIGDQDAGGNVISGKFADRLIVRPHPQGGFDSFAVQQIPEWTSDHRGDNICYVYVRLQWEEDEDVWETGIPVFRFLVRGKNDIYDPRTTLSGYHANSALCMLDYIRSEVGYNADDFEIDMPAAESAAQICDTLVDRPQGGQEPRYRTNGTLSMGSTLAENRDQLLRAMGGTLVNPGGIWRIFAASLQPIERAPLTADDLAGEISFQKIEGRDTNYNQVKGLFIDPDSRWQPVSFGLISDQTFLDEDLNKPKVKDMDLEMVTSWSQGQRLAWIDLRLFRGGSVFVATCNENVIDVAVWDVVQWDLPEYGFSNKMFRVTDMGIHPRDGKVRMVCRAVDPAFYADSPDDLRFIPPAPVSTLIPANQVPPPGAPMFSEETIATATGPVLKVNYSFAESPDSAVNLYDLQLKRTTESLWRSVHWSSETSGELTFLRPGLHDTRVRARNGVGFWSAYIQTSFNLTGFSGPPAGVQNLAIQVINGIALLSWTLSGDIDVVIGGNVVFRHNPATSGATWENSTAFGSPAAGNATSAALPLVSGTYLAKFRDSSQVFSIAAASVNTTGLPFENFVEDARTDEHPSFTGVKTNVVVVSNKLQLDGINSAGTYEFSTTLAGSQGLGNYRVQGEITAAVVSPGTVGQRTTNVSTWPSFVAGPAGAATAVNFYRTSSNGTTYGPWNQLEVADVNASHVQFKTELATPDLSVNIEISALSGVLLRPQ